MPESSSHTKALINQETLNQIQPDPETETLTPYNPEEVTEQDSGAAVFVPDAAAAPHNGKGKGNFEKNLTFEEKMQSLLEKLNPIPFQPFKILDFPTYENLLKKLGLWDFVNIDLDRNIRKDLIAELVIHYKNGVSSVNGVCIGVNKVELARAFKIPMMEGRTIGDELELCEDSIEFMVDFVSDWVLLHDDMWVMPNEVMDCLEVIQDGHPEKVDWAGLIWFMVEKELMKGVELGDCYYASHLQYLMKEHGVFDGKAEEFGEGDVNVGGGVVEGRGEERVFLREEEKEVNMMEVDLEAKELEKEAVNDGVANVNSVVEGRGEEKEAKELEEKAVNDGVGIECSVVEGRGEEKEAKMMEVDLEAKQVEEEAVNDGVGNISSVGEGRGEENVFSRGEEKEAEEVEEKGVNDGVGNVSIVVEDWGEENGFSREEGKEAKTMEVDLEAKEVVVKEEDLKVYNVIDSRGEENEPKTEHVDLEAEELEERDANDGDGVVESWVEENVCFREKDVNLNNVLGGPSFELTLGQDGEKEYEEIMVDFEECKESNEEQMKWLLNGVTGDHLLQPFSVENGGGFEGTEIETRRNEEESREVENFHLFSNDVVLDQGDGLTGNFLVSMEANPAAFTSHEQPSSMNINQMDPSVPSFFNEKGKRVIEHDDLNQRNKSMRIDNSWEEEVHKPDEFEMLLKTIHQNAERARIYSEEKQQALEQVNMNIQFVLAEIQKGDEVIDHLHKTKFEVISQKDAEISRYQQELYLMTSVLDGYRKNLTETQKKFDEYRQRAKLFEIEKTKKKQEEEYQMNCSIAEKIVKEAGDEYLKQFDGMFEKIIMLDNKLMRIEADSKELVGLSAKREIPQIVDNPLICSEGEHSKC